MHPFTVEGRGHDADSPPIPPVDDFGVDHQYITQQSTQRVLADTGRRVVGLTGVGNVGLDRGKQQDEIEVPATDCI
ncbi:hypothetical protein D3C85_1373190 [compost metagenome]